MLGNYTWFLNEALDGTAHVDYRERRGVGAGPDLNAHLGRWGEATLKYYYLHDNDPGASSTNAIPDNRQRVHFSYLATPFTNLSVRSLVRYQSDSAVVRDFFERDYAQTLGQAPQVSPDGRLLFYDLRSWARGLRERRSSSL